MGGCGAAVRPTPLAYFAALTTQVALPLSGLLLGRAHLPLDQPPSWRPLQRRSTRSHISGDLELEIHWRPLIGKGAQAAAAAAAAADAADAADAAIASPAPPPHPADTAGVLAPERAHVSAVSATAAAPRPSFQRSGSFWDAFAPERSPPAARPTLEPAWAAGSTAPPVALEFSACVAQSAPWEAAATAADDKDFWAQFDTRDGPSSSGSFGGAADVASTLPPAERLSAVRPGAASLGGGGSGSLWDDLASLEPGAVSTSTSPDLDLGLDLGLNLDLNRDLGLGLASPAGATPGVVAGAAGVESAPISSDSFWDAHAAVRPAVVTPPGSPACASLSSAGGSVGAPADLVAPAPQNGGGRREAREARRRKVVSGGEPQLVADEPSAEAFPPPPAAAGTFWDTFNYRQ